MCLRNLIKHSESVNKWVTAVIQGKLLMPGSPRATNLSRDTLSTTCRTAKVAHADNVSAEVFGIDKGFVIIAKHTVRRNARQ